MLIYPVIFGALSLLSPFLGLIVYMLYVAKTAEVNLTKPLQAFLMFIPVPVLMLILDPQTSTRLLCLDAILAVGLPILVFLLVLKNNHILSDSFMAAFLVMFAWGILRYYLFRGYQDQLFEQGIQLVKDKMPALLNSDLLQQTLPLWKGIIPSIWIISQAIAWLIGFLLFEGRLQIPNRIENLRFPVYYNLLIIAVLPLYFLDQTKVLFFNLLLSLCVIPFFQGAALVWQRLGMIFSNRIISGLFMLIIVLYANILLVLLGFGNMWFTKRNITSGGNTE